MSHEGAIQLACLYGPLVCGALLAWQVHPSGRFATGLLFALCWNAALLPWLDVLARQAGLWSYATTGITLGGMPLALYIGWIIAWGICAPLLSAALGERPWTVAALLIASDLRLMPEMEPVLILKPLWWIGETACVAVLLLPSLWMVKWTSARRHTGLRCLMLAPAFGGIFLGLPLLLEGGGLDSLMTRWHSFPGWGQGLIAGAAGLLSLPGLTALKDLARSGDGTPVPLDPPLRLVTHGIYAYVRNPMQISMTLLLLSEALFLSSAWPAILAALGMIYSEGLARWSENQDMRQRFGSLWTQYRLEVRSWWPRWKPRIGEPCELWLDASCDSCAELARWFKRRNPVQLQLRDASQWPGLPLERVTWHHPPSGRTESGVNAVAMALQHLNFAYATLGWISGLPGISHALQICFDAAGAGKRSAAIP